MLRGTIAPLSEPLGGFNGGTVNVLPAKLTVNLVRGVCFRAFRHPAGPEVVTRALQGGCERGV